MKHYFSYILAAVLCAALLPACNESEIEYNKAEVPLELTLSTDAAVLDIHAPAKEAIAFTWTAGTNGGTNSAIDYFLQIDEQGNNFDGGKLIEIGRRVYEYKYTHSQLNDLVLGDFGVPKGEAINLEARVIAMVSSEQASDQTSATMPFTVTSYVPPVTNTLFIIGSATPGGWSLNAATPMNTITNEVGGFRATVDLGAGELKFVVSKADFWPAFVKDGSAAEDKLIYYQDEPASELDIKFAITEAGRYRITANIVDLTINFEKLVIVGPTYAHWYFVGDLTGWGFEEMRQDPFNPFIFRYGAVLNGSSDRDFKFGTGTSWSVPFMHPTAADAPISSTAASVYAGDPDYKWKLTPAENNKAYKIELDVTEGSESMTMTEYTPLTTIYVIGGASPIGWGLGNRANAQMTQGADAYTYTWTGNLTVGTDNEIKFKCSDDGDWDNDASHPWYMAPEDGTPVVPNTDMELTLGTRGAGDRKWKVQEAGTYTIVIDQLKETVRFNKP
ncbi:hypothetical protein AGMMS4956_09390 [Bacteroidia bacterium]|nr:hypothetical protein AGMMS4956_09390 [Bacteroidia bacterium]